MIGSGLLLLIRQLWDAGLVHRDINLANLMVRDGKVLPVDAFFVQVRPSPWRQAVDPADMSSRWHVPVSTTGGGHGPPN